MKAKRLAKLVAHGKPMILTADAGGRPYEWVDWKQAAAHYVGGDVLWSTGDPVISLHGGMDHNGQRSILEISPVIAVTGINTRRVENKTIYLTNETLFKRDKNTCMYCGEVFTKSLLSRDHVEPQGRGGPDVWTNVVTACKPCNYEKAMRSPEEACMKLLALPFAPSHVEGLILSNKKILADQMDFLMAQRPNIRKGN